jgi:O-antigen ligase
MAAIERAERLGWQLFALLLALSVIATVLLRRWRVSWRRLAAVALLVVIHPGWWLTARGGDCGAMRLMGSIGVTAIGAVALLVALVVTGMRRQRERR